MAVLWFGLSWLCPWSGQQSLVLLSPSLQWLEDDSGAVTAGTKQMSLQGGSASQRVHSLEPEQRAVMAGFSASVRARVSIIISCEMMSSRFSRQPVNAFLKQVESCRKPCLQASRSNSGSLKLHAHAPPPLKWTDEDYAGTTKMSLCCARSSGT